MTDYYSILGVNKTSTEDEIKRAYRKLAMKHHPDRGGDETKFKEINQAYETLSNPAKKAEYDNPAPASNFSFNGHQMPPGFEDLFSDLFSGRSHGFQQPTKNKTINLQTNISLEQAFNGAELSAEIQLPSGKQQSVVIKVPAGVHSGTVLRAPNIGDDTFSSLPRGDIMLHITVLPHVVYHRSGDDLLMETEVSLWDALLEKVLTVSTIDNKTLEVKIPKNVQMGQMLSIASAGMPNPNDHRYRGRLLLKLKIKLPTNLTEEQLTLIQSLSILTKGN
jgi:curved DNA-binding protein